MERLAKAGPGKGWHLARTSTFYFDAVHAPYCGNALGKNLKSFNAELCQLSIEALGRCGHSGWGYQLRSLLAGDDDYYLEKYGSYVVEALARHFVRSVTEVGMQIFGPSQKLRDELIHLHDKRSGSISYSTLRQILGECNGRHADALIRDWLTSEYSTVVKLAADVLGGCRIVRGVKPLMEVMERWSETTVVRSCSSAIGNIATSEAIHQLLAPGPNIERGYGLVFALEKIDDMPTFRQAVVKLIDTKSELNYFVLRAIGQKRAEEFMKFLLSAFEGSEPIERGIAALALARLEQAKKIQKDKFLLAYKQAADTIERIFTALAVLTVEPTVFAELESQLREDLGKESYLYWPALQTDILDVLLKSGDSRAIELANAWRPFYQRAYLERIST